MGNSRLPSQRYHVRIPVTVCCVSSTELHFSPDCRLAKYRSLHILGSSRSIGYLLAFTGYQGREESWHPRTFQTTAWLCRNQLCKASLGEATSTKIIIKSMHTNRDSINEVHLAFFIRNMFVRIIIHIFCLGSNTETIDP